MEFLLLAIVAIVAILVAWLVSEFQGRAWLRILLGVLAISTSFGVAYIVGQLQRLNYNAWYGAATQSLVAAEIEALDAGRPDAVKSGLVWFQSQYHPTYENRAHYDQLAEQTAERIRTAVGPTTSSARIP